MRAWWLAVCMLLLAGCSDPGPEASDDGDASGLSGSAAQQGTPTPGEAPASGSAAASAASAAVPDPVDVAWDGLVAAQACVPAGLGSCVGASVPDLAGRTSDLRLPAPPAAWNGTLTLTWQAASPATETLLIAFGFYKPCGSTCWETAGQGVYLEGRSPLTLDAAGALAAADSEGLWISVHARSLTPDPVYALAHSEQPFRVEGHLEAAPSTAS